MFSVRGIDCATCAIGIEKRLRKVEGIRSVESSIMLNTVFVDYDESKVSISEIMGAMKKTGYSSHLTRQMGASR